MSDYEKTVLVDVERFKALRAAWDAVPNGGQVPTSVGKWLQPLLNAVTEIVAPDHEAIGTWTEEPDAWMLTTAGRRVVVQLARKPTPGDSGSWFDAWLCGGCGRVSIRAKHYVIRDGVDVCEHCRAGLGSAKWIGLTSEAGT